MADIEDAIEQTSQAADDDQISPAVSLHSFQCSDGVSPDGCFVLLQPLPPDLRKTAPSLYRTCPHAPADHDNQMKPAQRLNAESFYQCIQFRVQQSKETAMNRSVKLTLVLSAVVLMSMPSQSQAYEPGCGRHYVTHRCYP